jgi:hypothetical protein
MPGSGLAQNKLFANVLGFSENRQRQGLSDYLDFTRTTAPLMTDPRLASDIADRNALFAAAPDPQAAAERELQEWWQKFEATQMASRGFGGPAGGTRGWAPGVQTAGVGAGNSMGGAYTPIPRDVGNPPAVGALGYDTDQYGNPTSGGRPIYNTRSILGGGGSPYLLPGGQDTGNSFMGNREDYYGIGEEDLVGG